MAQFAFTQSINGTVEANDLLEAQGKVQGNIPAIGDGITIIGANVNVTVPMVTIPATGNPNDPNGDGTGHDNG